MKNRATRLALLLSFVFLPRGAQAGVPECGNLRLQDVSGCEVVGRVDCQAGCSEFGVYNKSCATKLHTVCRKDCDLDADVVCVDHCSAQCTSDCDAGIDVICTHNCFGECAGGCEASCSGAEDSAQCVAACEATCDGECDIKCQPLVDASCYEHCTECCHGSCTAQINWSCQETCQEEQFTECEQEFRAECDASCDLDGALFCDGEFAIAGAALPACVQALVAQGIAVAHLEASLEGQFGSPTGPGGNHSGGPLVDPSAATKSSAKVGCSAAPMGPGGAGQLWFFGALLLPLLHRRRRR